MAGAGAKVFVERKLRQSKVVLFSKAHDPACKRAKEILKSYGLQHPDYEFVDIECRQDVTQIENYFQIICLTDRREVPRLFLCGKYVGGDFEIRLKHNSGELEREIRFAVDSTACLQELSSSSIAASSLAASSLEATRN